MPGFDITSIRDFQPPKIICPACRGLMRSIETDYKVKPWKRSCKVCGVEYVEDPESQRWGGRGDNSEILDHFKQEGWIVNHRDLFAHATALADVVHKSRTQDWPTMRTLFEVISRARYFVHFTTWGISHLMIGALKMASVSVPVYGFASDVEAHARAELTEFPREAPQLTAKVIPSSQGIYDAPHQKILIIDGLVAFKGSTNLTNAGARRADRGLDVSEMVTDFEQVTELNNKYFAPVWRRIASPEDKLVWSAAPF